MAVPCVLLIDITEALNAVHEIRRLAEADGGWLPTELEERIEGLAEKGGEQLGMLERGPGGFRLMPGYELVDVLMELRKLRGAREGEK